MNLILRRPERSFMERAIDDFFNDDIFTFQTGSDYPRVDVKEDENNYTLEADIPGIKEKDLDIKVDGNLLTISSKQNKKKEDKKKNYILKERRVSAFSRSFVLPKDVDTGKIKANYSNGHLELSLPKSEAAKPKQIEINS